MRRARPGLVAAAAVLAAVAGCSSSGTPAASSTAVVAGRTEGFLTCTEVPYDKASGTNDPTGTGIAVVSGYVVGAMWVSCCGGSPDTFQMTVFLVRDGREYGQGDVVTQSAISDFRAGQEVSASERCLPGTYRVLYRVLWTFQGATTVQNADRTTTKDRAVTAGDCDRGPGSAVGESYKITADRHPVTGDIHWRVARLGRLRDQCPPEMLRAFAEGEPPIGPEHPVGHSVARGEGIVRAVGARRLHRRGARVLLQGHRPGSGRLGPARADPGRDRAPQAQRRLTIRPGIVNPACAQKAHWIVRSAGVLARRADGEAVSHVARGGLISSPLCPGQQDLRREVSPLVQELARVARGPEREEAVISGNLAVLVGRVPTGPVAVHDQGDEAQLVGAELVGHTDILPSGAAPGRMAGSG